MNGGRIVASVRIGNVTDASKTFRCDALVDTGASHWFFRKHGKNGWVIGVHQNNTNGNGYAGDSHW